MFNSAIFWKTLRDSRWSIILTSVGLITFVIFFVLAMENMGKEVLEFVSKFPFIKKIFEMTLGINTSGEMSINIMLAVCFTHGVVLALTATNIVATVTRVTAGEIEKGTADILLTLPVTRTNVFISTTAAWLLSTMVLAICPIVGISIARQFVQSDELIELERYIGPTVNFFCFLLAIGGVSTLVACVSNRRSPAVGIIVAVLLSSMVLSFLEPFLAWIKHIRFLSLLNYFRPVDIVRTGEWPVSSLIGLLSIGIIGWLTGLVIFSRKDIPTA